METSKNQCFGVMVPECCPLCDGNPEMIALIYEKQMRWHSH